MATLNLQTEVGSLQKLPYLFRKIGDHVFLSSSLGTWLLLSSEDFDAFAAFPSASLESSLSQKLHDHLFLVDPNSTTDIERVGSLKKWRDESNTKGPGLFLVGVTRKCNLKCPYCHLSATPGKAREDDSLKQTKVIHGIVDFILDSPNPEVAIEFQGGEPLLAFGFIQEFVTTIKEKNKAVGKGVSFSATSNLTLLTDDKIDYLAKEQISLSGTVDGMREVHDSNRPFVSNRGSFDVVLKKRALLKQKGVHVNLLSIITKKSLGKAKEIADLIFGLDQKILLFNKIQRLGRASQDDHWSEFGLSNEEYFDFWKETIEHVFSLHKEGVLVTERYLHLILEKLFGDDPHFVDWRNPNGAIISTIGFDDEGFIYPSDEAREILELRLGNVSEHKYGDILENPLSKQILNAAILEGQFCNTCAYKSICGLCPINSYKNTKEFLSSHHHPTNRCNLNMAMFDHVLSLLIERPEAIKAALFASSILYNKKITYENH